MGREVILMARKEVAKPWGRMDVPAQFRTQSAERIGEIWFEHFGETPDLLVKFLFTSEKLSIQVHPDDELAKISGLRSGKEECWLVLDAAPGAVLGIGTRQAISPEQLRIAALDGSIEHLIDWKPVSKGDFYYIPAGTVHAIGAGVTLVEIQQNADITYRLYDYGRPRKLHLDEAIEAASARPFPSNSDVNIDLGEPQQLVSGPKFDVWLGDNWPETGLSDEWVHIVPLAGVVAADGVTVKLGDCLMAKPGIPLEMSENCKFLIAQSRCAQA